MRAQYLYRQPIAISSPLGVFQAQKNRLSAVYDITTYCFDYSVFLFPGTRGGT